MKPFLPLAGCIQCFIKAPEAKLEQIQMETLSITMEWGLTLSRWSFTASELTHFITGGQYMVPKKNVFLSRDDVDMVLWITFPWSIIPVSPCLMIFSRFWLSSVFFPQLHLCSPSSCPTASVRVSTKVLYNLTLGPQMDHLWLGRGNDSVYRTGLDPSGSCVQILRGASLPMYLGGTIKHLYSPGSPEPLLIH